MILNGGQKNHQFFITYDIQSIFGVMIKIKLTNGFPFGFASEQQRNLTYRYCHQELSKILPPQKRPPLDGDLQTQTAAEIYDKNEETVSAAVSTASTAAASKRGA